MNPDDFKSALLARLGLTPAPTPAPSKSGQLLAAALGQPPSPVQPDATFVQNGPPRFPQMPTRSIGPVTKGNIPLPEATYQSQYRPRYDKAMSALADMLPVIGPARALYQAHQTAQQGHPLAAALGAALAAAPMGGRIARAADEGAEVAQGVTRLYRAEPKDLGDQGAWLQKHISPEQWQQFIAERGRLFSDRPLPQYGFGEPTHNSYYVDVPQDVAKQIGRLHHEGKFTEYVVPDEYLAQKRLMPSKP